MVNISIRATDKQIPDDQLVEALKKSIEGRSLKKILLLPPDITRLHSYAGKITALYYQLLKDTCQVDIMPALGTHDPMPEHECVEFFGPEIPFSAYIPHRWKEDVVKIGTVPAEYVKEVSEGLIDYPIDVEVNEKLLDPTYDLIISIGQVVPHEVVGMANYSKNVFVGCGGKTIINRSHFLGAVYGMERLMGKDNSPVRSVFDYAEAHFIKDLPLMYVLTVTTVEQGLAMLQGLYIGRERILFENAIAQSQALNFILLDRAPKKVVVYLDEREFKSTWLGNKAVYRTRMAIADDGELLILAPGVKKFGEDAGIDLLLRKYGYVGRMKVLEAYKANQDLQENLSAAAHLIHGSSDGRFSITYAVEQLTQAEVEGVNFNYMKLTDAVKRYDPTQLKDGWNVMPDGEEIFYISNPAIGLWADRKKFLG
ncbi:MAG: lactate racemase domain-containing protein [Eubacteriales bacterium]|nr:lactate racemase domain-containing protein [Eubacteriales bacterium]